MSNTVSQFPIPRSIELDPKTATENYGKFTISPLQSGFGHTLGNALRRVLLSSLEGVAIRSVKFDDAVHEFASIPHIVEDVTEIVLNLKRVLLKMHSEEDTKTLEIRKDKSGPVTAANIVTDGTVEVLNPDQIICTLDKDFRFNAEIVIGKGCGYVPSEKNKDIENQPVGTIAIDSLYSPVVRVRYNVGVARLGEVTEMDSLIIEIWTDGRICPKDALEKAALIFHTHLVPFFGENVIPDKPTTDLSDDEQKQLKILTSKVDDLELSVRSQNCLKNANLRLIGELCTKSEPKMLKYRNFGRVSLDEIKLKLETLELSLGMSFNEKITQAIDAESKKFKEQQKTEED
jgi:DNA-directed RNA polymerase subunit alpha